MIEETKNPAASSPNEAPSIIYHYCDTAAFQSIIESRSLWLTDLYQTNDAKEGLEVSEVIAELLSELGLEAYRANEWKETFNRSLDYFQAFGFCASEEDDLLSQWRGYASDGTGFSIGFNRGFLENSARLWNQAAKHEPVLILEKVKYQRAEQKLLLEDAARALYQHIKDGALEHNRPLSLLSFAEDEQTKQKKHKAWSGMIGTHTMLALLRRYEMKHISFREEKEWRLFAIRGNRQEQPEDTSKNIGFRARRDTFVPYFRFSFEPKDAIGEIVLGPKNRTPDYVIKQFLHLNGLGGASVKRSASTYL